MKQFSKTGSVLILSIWTMTFLTFFAVHIGLRIQQRASVLKKIEQRSQLRFAVDSGIKKAISALKQDLKEHNYLYTHQAKINRHNNEEDFSDIEIGGAICKISYPDPTMHSETDQKEIYGYQDEESKLNLNTANYDEIKRLVLSLMTNDEDEAKQITLSILDWRSFGKTEITGFYSDSYYEMLEFPYQSKSSQFEVLNELLLVRGFTQANYQRMLPYVTIYGDGQVNINTASREVLMALGLPEELTDKILDARRGVDSTDHTDDDVIFQKAFDIASDVKRYVKLTDDEVKLIDWLNDRGRLKTNSYYYRFRAKGQSAFGGDQLAVLTVYNTRENRLEYWSEI